ncbi:hypothetical protein [Streptomyces profundus]|uniref:hypothetical protein n=1 Tax=Streptomyces profundus TaxID=2867410 RepID=UPI001D161A00|nr:hypothetical protein [Streptomyces sp. MA3_2.13]UED83176.1 hypothetical protein K4G22_02325 [Streptomyces sp. MA3_2.13]
MAEPAAAATPVVVVDYHMFYLAEPGEPSKADAPVHAANGLVSSRPGMAVIFTGASSGSVILTVQTFTSPPQNAPTEDWEEVVEHSVLAPAGALRVTTVMTCGPPDLPLLTPSGPGPYRLRVHASGRDMSPDGVAREPRERYLIASWPAPHQPDHVHHQTDRYGAQLRAASGPPTPASSAPRLPDHKDAQREHLRRNLRRIRQDRA